MCENAGQVFAQTVTCSYSLTLSKIFKHQAKPWAEHVGKKKELLEGKVGENKSYLSQMLVSCYH